MSERRRMSKQEKRRTVEETLRPGSSVSIVARQHGINANQLFRWRRLYREGRLEVETESKLLPVRISDVVEGSSTGNRSGIASCSRRYDRC